MKKTMRVVSRVLVAEFYRINAGFFLLVFILVFGIASARDSLMFQYYIMQEIVRSGTFFAVFCGLWILYSLKCTVFVLRSLGAPEHSFFYELQALPTGRQIRLLAGCHSLVYLPMLLYALITAGIGIAEGHAGMALLVLVIQAALTTGAVALYLYGLNQTHREGAPDRLTALLGRRRSRPRTLLLYLPAYTLQHRKITLLTIKVSSLLLLQLMVSLNKDRLELEGTYFFMMLLITAHALLPFYYVTFTEAEGWLRNLPVSRWRWAGYYAGTYALLFLPELLFLVLHTRDALPASAILSLYVLAIVLMCFFTAVLYIPRLPVDRYTLVVFASFLLAMLLLAAIGIWVLSAVLACLAAVLFWLAFYRYEDQE